MSVPSITYIKRFIGERQKGFKKTVNSTGTRCHRGKRTQDGNCFPLEFVSDLDDMGLKAMAPHSSHLAWKSPWTEEPGRLQSIGSGRV